MPCVPRRDLVRAQGVPKPAATSAPCLAEPLGARSPCHGRWRRPSPVSRGTARQGGPAPLFGACSLCAGAGAWPELGVSRGGGQGLGVTGQRPSQLSSGSPHPRGAALPPSWCVSLPFSQPEVVFFQAGRVGGRAGGGGQTGAGWAVPVSPCYPACALPGAAPGGDPDPRAGAVRGHCPVRGGGCKMLGRAGPCAGRAVARGAHGGCGGGYISLWVPWGPRLGFPPLYPPWAWG